MLQKTQRSFKDVESSEIFNLFMDSDTHEFKLISDGSKKYAKRTEVNGFYICAHTSCTIKINGKKQVELPMGKFYNLKEGEKITHKKYCGFKRFSKA